VTDSALPPLAAQGDLKSNTSLVVKLVLRVTVSVAGLFTAYYLLPLDRSSTWTAATILVIGLAGFIALATFHVRSIPRAPFPGLRAIEALAINIPLFLLLFRRELRRLGKHIQ
jgi:hypothetical protein